MATGIGSASPDEVGGDDVLDSLDELSPSGGESPEDYGVRILKILQQIMDNNAEAMQQFFEILSNGDKNKAAYMMEVLEKNLDQLKKQDRAKGLKIFMKILSVFALIISALVVLINPTPFAVAMLVISIALFMEPMVAEAAGYESLLGRAFKEVFKIFKEMGMRPSSLLVFNGLTLHQDAEQWCRQMQKTFNRRVHQIHLPETKNFLAIVLPLSFTAMGVEQLTARAETLMRETGLDFTAEIGSMQVI